MSDGQGAQTMPWHITDKRLFGGRRCAGHLLPQEAAHMEPGASSSTVKLLTQTAVSSMSHCRTLLAVHYKPNAEVSATISMA